MRYLILLIGMVFIPATAFAQRPASAFLPADHWAHAALRELEMRGAISTDFIDPGSRTTTVLTALDAFSSAASDEGLKESTRQRAAAYASLLRDEYGEDEAAERSAALRSGGEYENHEGRVFAGDGYYLEEDWTGARPRDPISAGSALLGVNARSGPIGFSADASVGAESRIRNLQVVGRILDAQLWAGRRASAYGPGTRGVVINSDVAFNGAGIGMVHPVRFPSFFRGQGRINLEGYVAQLDSVGLVDDPWFFAARLAYSPHPRFVVGINRGAVFGGEDNSPVTLTNIMRMMIGLYSGDASDFENQIISFDMRYRVPKIPVVAYYEWGMDDGAGAWVDVPGITAGATLPLEVGGAPVDLTVERTSFDPSCCGNPIWYRHGRFRGSWADDGVMIGNPLGGHGHETAIAVGFATRAAALRGRLRGYVRERGDENVFAPERAGGSSGAEVQVGARATDRIEVEALFSTEEGEQDWSETRLVVGARIRLLQRQ